MDELLSTVESAFEDEGYDLVDVSQNRDTVRVAVREGGVESDLLRSVVTETVGEDSVFALDVQTESVDGVDGMSTVVTFRHRS